MRSLLALTVLVMSVLGNASAHAQLFESHFVFRGGYPIGQTAWSPHIKGVAHDDNFWYFTLTNLPPNVAYPLMWKVPVGADLATVSASTPGVQVLQRSDVPALINFTVYGDPDVFRFHGVDYLLVPVSSNNGITAPTIAFFRCDTLSFITRSQAIGSPGSDASWVSVNDAGELFTSRTRIDLNSPPERGLQVFQVDWAALETPSPLSINVVLDRTQSMLNEANQPLVPGHIQGGEFAPGSQLLYLVSGSSEDDNATADSEGIHVLDTATFRRIRHSTRGVSNQIFDFYYNPGGTTLEQPQGLTIWDLDDGRAPGILGQLHVLVDELSSVDFKHYTRAISVNPNGPACQFGTPQCPWHSIGTALSNSWPGSEIRIRGGTYPSPLIVNQRVRISAENGVVRLGG